MTAATPSSPSTPGRLRRHFVKPPDAIPSRVHTIRFHDPMWDTAKTLAWWERREEGVSEIVREVMAPLLREKLREAGVEIADDEVITEEHAAAYYQALRRR